MLERMDLGGVARELLRAAPGDFVAERTARQRNVRTHDRSLASAIGGIRKPSPAAWVVDLLAADGALDDAVDLAPTLRRAQERADPAEIRTLRRRRAELLATLAHEGADRASAAGHAVTEAVLDQVRATIDAAMSDPRAGEAVRSGLLVRALESAGFDPVDLDGAVAVPEALPFDSSAPVAEPVPITAGRRGSGRRAAVRRQVAGSHDDAADARERARAEVAAARDASRTADAALDAAEDALADAESRRTALDRRHRELDDERRALDRRDAELDTQTTELDGALQRLASARDDAEAASDRARDALTAARRQRGSR